MTSTNSVPAISSLVAAIGHIKYEVAVEFFETADDSFDIRSDEVQAKLRKVFTKNDDQFARVRGAYRLASHDRDYALRCGASLDVMIDAERSYSIASEMALDEMERIDADMSALTAAFMAGIGVGADGAFIDAAGNPIC